MLITNFASGELSETLNGRVDLQQYYSGAARLSNFEIIPTGGIKRRRGTVRCAQLAGECRLIPFIIDKNESFVLALKAGQATIYKSGAIYAAQNTFTIPYANLTEIKEIQYVQDYDRLVLVHKSYKPQIIKYDSSLHTFSCSAMDFMFYPDVYLDDDFDYIMLPYNAEPSRVSTADNHLKFTYNVQIDGQTVTKTKEYAKEENAYYILNGTLFEYEYGGNSWHNYNNDNNIDTTLFSEAGKYPGCAAFYNSRLFFASTDLGRQTIWASAAPNAKGTRYNNFSTFRKYVTVNQVTKPADAHGFTCSISLEDIDTVMAMCDRRGANPTMLVMSPEKKKRFSSLITNMTQINRNMGKSRKIDLVADVVETDFGAIDARISSQLTELENKIIEVSPVKNIKRSDPLATSE